jgi:hypothetical protein
MKQYITNSYIDFKKAYDSVRKEVLYYNILIEFGVHMNPVRLIKMLIKQLMVRQRNNSSSPPLMLLPQHVSVIRPSSVGIQ